MFSGTWCGGMDAGGWLLMVAFWVAFLALVVWAVMQIFPRNASRSSNPTEEITASDVLDRRLAAGEIDVETYSRLQQELRAGVR